jgi:uncharacterized SAM-binding protein YcdF (DUF218 family)
MRKPDRNTVQRVFKRSAIVASVFILVVFVIDATFILKFPKRALPPQGTEADVIVVLGAAINSRAVFNRTIKGLRMYEADKGRQLVLAGGKTSKADETESHYMGRVVVANAVEPPRFILEQASQNTWENLHYTRRLVPDAQSVLIISDTFHLPRAVLVAKKAGFTEVYWDSPDQYYYSSDDLRWYYFREMVALLDYMPRLVF